MRSAPVMLPLLLIAAGCASAAACVAADHQLAAWLQRDALRWGLGFANVQMLVAAIVFWRRHLWIWLGLLAFELVAWAQLIADGGCCKPWHAAVDLMGVALATAALCGWLWLCGWRPATLHPRTESEKPGHQFSLATALLVMALVAVFSGLLRSTGFHWHALLLEASRSLPALRIAQVLVVQLAYWGLLLLRYALPALI